MPNQQSQSTEGMYMLQTEDKYQWHLTMTNYILVVLFML